VIRGIALLLTFFTGSSGLVYEVAWQKVLAALLGSHSEATAAVLAIYLGGLAAGYALFGRVTARSGRLSLLRLYGIVEFGIGVWALLFPWFFTAAQGLSVAMAPANEALGFGFDVLLATFLIGPPTVLMGGTIPVLTQALARDTSDATRVHAWIYSTNTAGAFLGALAGGFFLVPWLGLDGVVRTMAIVNLGAGVVFVLSGGAGRAAAPAAETPGSRQPESFAGYAVVAVLAGFSMMTVQTVLNRIGALSLGASHFTFSMVVAVFVLCIALGSFAVSALRTIPAWLIVGLQWLLAAIMVGLYFVLPDTTYWAHVIRSLFRDEAAAFFPYYGAVFTAMLAVLFVPIGISGALLPLLFHHLRDRMGELGSVAGKLYSWNTVGSLLGALLGGYALLFFIDLDQVYALAVGGLFFVALGVTILVGRMPLALGAIGAVVVLFLGTQLPEWDSNRLAAGTFRQRHPTPNSYSGPKAFYRQGRLNHVFHTDDPIASVTVVRNTQKGKPNHAIMTNGKADGSLGPDYPTMAITGLLPALFTDDPSRSFVIGWGTGVTIGELAALEGTREVLVAEISPGVLEAAPLFDYGNLAASKNPKVEILRSDAYRALLRSEGQFGVIASEPSNPWVAGVEMLFSRDFLEAARSRLTPGGIYAQWFHLYETDRETVEMVLRTYAEVFDSVSIWYTFGPDLILLGHNAPDDSLDLERLRKGFEQRDFRAGFARARIGSFPTFLSHELIPLGTPEAAGLKGPIHTLRHPRLSHLAASAFFHSRRAEVPSLPQLPSARVGARNSLLRRAGPLDEATLGEIVRHTCEMQRLRECATWLARMIASFPDSEQTAELRRRREARLTEFLKLEPGALDSLAGFYEGKVPSLSGSGFSDALQATKLFERFYLHAAPFPRRVLSGAWRNCREVGVSLRCYEARRKAGERLGDLTAQVDLGSTPGAPLR
jgi:spermidine synthase